GDNPPTRASAVSRFHADRAGKGCRLADRTTGIRAGRTEAQARCNGGSRTSRRTARSERSVRALPPPGRMHGAEIRSLVGGSHRKFIAIGLAEKHRTVTPELRRHSRFIGRHEIVEDMRTGRRTYARRAEHVLDGKRNALKWSGVALCDACVGRFGHLDGAFWSMQDKRIERPRLLDRRLMCARQFGRGEGFLFQSVSRLDQTERGQFTHDGTHPHVAARNRARAFPARLAPRNEIPFLRNDFPFPSTPGAPLRERRSSTGIRAHRRYTLSKPLAWNDALRSFHHLGHHEIIVLAHRCVSDDIFRNAPVSYRIDPFLHRHGSYRSHR